MENIPSSLTLSQPVRHGQVAPFAVTKKQAMRLVAMPKLVQRWMHYGWIEIVRQGGRGRETVIDFQSLKHAYELYKKGEEPPPLPSEGKALPKADGAWCRATPDGLVGEDVECWE